MFVMGFHYVVNEYLLNGSLPHKLMFKINIFVTLLTFLVINTLDFIKKKLFEVVPI